LERTGLDPKDIKRALQINEEVIGYLRTKYPRERMVNWYVAGLLEERMRLFFRIPEGVKNIDIDCIEIHDKRGILAFVEFKKGLLSPYDEPPKKIASTAEMFVLQELSDKQGSPSFVVRFNTDFDAFQIYEVGNETLSYETINLKELWEWRRSL